MQEVVLLGGYDVTSFVPFPMSTSFLSHLKYYHLLQVMECAGWKNESILFIAEESGWSPYSFELRIVLCQPFLRGYSELLPSPPTTTTVELLD